MPIFHPHSSEEDEDTEPLTPPPPLSFEDEIDTLQFPIELDTRLKSSRCETVESVTRPAYTPRLGLSLTQPSPIPVPLKYSINLFIERAIEETTFDFTTSRVQLFRVIDSLIPKLHSIFQDKDAYDDADLLFYCVKRLYTMLIILKECKQYIYFATSKENIINSARFISQFMQNSYSRYKEDIEKIAQLERSNAFTTARHIDWDNYVVRIIHPLYKELIHFESSCIIYASMPRLLDLSKQVNIVNVQSLLEKIHMNMIMMRTERKSQDSSLIRCFIEEFMQILPLRMALNDALGIPVFQKRERALIKQILMEHDLFVDLIKSRKNKKEDDVIFEVSKSTPLHEAKEVIAGKKTMFSGLIFSGNTIQGREPNRSGPTNFASHQSIVEDQPESYNPSMITFF